MKSYGRKPKVMKITLNAPTVLCFVVLAFGATLLGVLSGGELTGKFFATYRGSWLNPLTYLRLFTHVLGHRDFNHFIGNASYLLLLGPILEEKHGGARLLEVILMTALITGLINTLFFPGISLCGASGVVFAFILLTSFTGFREGELPITVILVAAIYIGQQVMAGMFVKDNISNMAHIVGGIVGAIAGYALNKKKKY